MSSTSEVSSAPKKCIFLSYAWDSWREEQLQRYEGGWAAHLIRVWLSMRFPELEVFLDCADRIHGSRLPSMLPGQPFPSVIKNAIRSSDLFMAILSPKYVDDERANWCLAEKGYQLETQREPPLHLHVLAQPCFDRGLHFHGASAIGDLSDFLSIFRRHHRDRTTSSYEHAALECLIEMRTTYEGRQLLDRIAKAITSSLNGTYRDEYDNSTVIERLPVFLGHRAPVESQVFVRSDLLAVVRQCCMDSRVREAGRPVLVLGKSGSGKTWLVHQMRLLDPAQTGLKVIASHFCLYGDQDSRSANAFVNSLIRQFAETIQGYREWLRNNPTVLRAHLDGDSSAEMAFHRLIVKPLRDLALVPDENPCVVLVDAIDELLDVAGECTVLDLLRLWEDYMPPWMTLIATGHPIATASSNRPYGLGGTLILMPAFEGNANTIGNDDIHHYVASRVSHVIGASVDDNDRNAIVRRVVQEAEGSFRHAALILESWQHTGGDANINPETLWQFYERQLRRLMDPMSEADQGMIAMLLSILLVARQPLTMDQLCLLLDQTPEELDQLTALLSRGFLSLWERRSGERCLVFQHRSASNWLEETTPAGISVQRAHVHITTFCAMALADGRFDSCPYLSRHGVYHAIASLHETALQGEKIGGSFHSRLDRALVVIGHLHNQQTQRPNEVRLQYDSHRHLLTILWEHRKRLFATSEMPGSMEQVLYRMTIEGCDDIPTLCLGLRLVIGLFPDTWSTHRKALLESDQLVTRHAAGRSYADWLINQSQVSTIQSELEHHFPLLEGSDKAEREYAAYMLRFLFVSARVRNWFREPFAAFCEQMARATDFNMRMILYECLIDIASEDAYEGDIRDFVTESRFWDPVWPYLQSDRDECFALVHARTLRLGNPDQEAQVVDCRGLSDAVTLAVQRYARIEALRKQLLVQLESRKDFIGPLRDYWCMSRCVDQLHEILRYVRRLTPSSQVGTLEQVRDYLTVFALHPQWYVAETASSLLSSMIDFHPRYRSIINEWAESSEWHCRYAAADAAFNARNLPCGNHPKQFL
ncbi:MAG: hypothetical protein AAGD07_13160, partial [Planctomycetota bacterium]